MDQVAKEQRQPDDHGVSRKDWLATEEVEGCKRDHQSDVAVVNTKATCQDANRRCGIASGLQTGAETQKAGEQFDPNGQAGRPSEQLTIG